MSTQCTPPPLEFHAFGRRQVVGRFDAGRLTSDGGTILLREVDRRLGLMGGVAGCFTDYRDPDKVDHSVLERVHSTGGRYSPGLRRPQRSRCVAHGQPVGTLGGQCGEKAGVRENENPDDLTGNVYINECE